jgi:hypothetical protein
MYTMNHVYQIYLSNWYLYYYYSFLGEHLILADLVRWRWTRFHSDSLVYTDSTVPITRGCSYLFDASTDKVAPTSSEINVEHYYLKTDGPSGLLQDYLLCKCVQSTDESWRQKKMNISRRKTTKKGCPRWYVFLIQKEKSGSIHSVFNIVIFDFDKIDLIL